MAGGLFNDYDLGGFYDEAVGPDGTPRHGQEPVVDWFDALTPDDLRYHGALRDDVLRSRGITFTVYGEAQGIERTWPMDLFPRSVRPDRGGVDRLVRHRALAPRWCGRRHLGPQRVGAAEGATPLAPSIVGEGSSRTTAPRSRSRGAFLGGGVTTTVAGFGERWSGVPAAPALDRLR